MALHGNVNVQCMAGKVFRCVYFGVLRLVFSSSQHSIYAPQLYWYFVHNAFQYKWISMCIMFMDINESCLTAFIFLHPFIRFMPDFVSVFFTVVFVVVVAFLLCSLSHFPTRRFGIQGLSHFKLLFSNKRFNNVFKIVGQVKSCWCCCCCCFCFVKMNVPSEL